MRIVSFDIDHDSLCEGIYESRRARIAAEVVTYDIRLFRPNKERMTPSIAHTLEHLLAVWFRNLSGIQMDVIYVGPMGCLTGFYLVLAGKHDISEVKRLFYDAMEWIAGYRGAVAGAKRKECGSYKMHNLKGAVKLANEYIYKNKQKK